MQAWSFSELVFYFTLYNIIGWLCETLWCSIANKRFVNPGFLSGPWLPIYGFGVINILFIGATLAPYPPLMFLACLVTVAVLEYFTSWLLEALFKLRFWDYSTRRFNLRGRICLRNTLLFAAMSCLAFYFMQPLAADLFAQISPLVLQLLASLIIVIFLLDVVLSMMSATKHSNAMLVADARDELLMGPHIPVERYNWLSPKGLLRGFLRLITLLDERARSFWQKGSSKREEIKLSYKEVNITKLVWIFFIACVLGYIAETLFAIGFRGLFESRQGLLYGPFSQVYGIGAVLLVLVLTPFVKRGIAWLFVSSAIFGGLFETVCSLTQEYLFGSVSWDYTSMPFGMLGGRTNLLYMFFWGVLGVLYMRFVYPGMVHVVELIPKRAKHLFTWVIIVVLAADITLSALAVSRWSGRMAGQEPQHRGEMWLDEYYNNDMLERIYPNMRFPTQYGK